MNYQSPLERFVSGIAIIKRPKPGFWPLQVIGLLDTMAFWSMAGILVISLTDDFGYSDVEAGQLFSVSVVAMTVSMFFAGTVADALGIRRALLLAFGGSILTRGAIFFVGTLTDSPITQAIIFASLVLMGPCVAVLQTIYSVGSKLYTYPGQQSAGFNVVYICLNIGAAGAGLMVDFLFLIAELPRYYVLGAGTILGLTCFFITSLWITPADKKQMQEVVRQPSTLSKIVRLLRETVSKETFWRLIVFVTLLTPIRAVLIYYTLLAPKYWLRMIGPDAKIGLFVALNPILVIVGTLATIPYLIRIDIYSAIATGSVISATSLFMLSIPLYSVYDIACSTQVLSVLFLLLLTVGEITWAPRLMQYTAAVAPHGLEATYLGISGLPLGLSKMFIAYVSGYMLQRWVPPNVVELLESDAIGYWDSPAAMWLILAVVTTASAVAIIVLRAWITKGTVFAKPSSLGQASSVEVGG